MNMQTDYSFVPCVLCLGYFDGVHLGHQSLLLKAKQIAEKNGWKVVVHTFSASPREVITGKKDTLLTQTDEKCRLLKQYGADGVIITDFDDSVRCMSGEEYLDNVLLKMVNCRHIVVGEDHRFGYMGKTDCEELKRICEERKIGLDLAPQIYMPDGEKISSNRIRSAIAEEKYDLARDLLGHDIELLNRKFR